jgi:hypothetical protein
MTDFHQLLIEGVAILVTVYHERIYSDLGISEAFLHRSVQILALHAGITIPVCKCCLRRIHLVWIGNLDRVSSLDLGKDVQTDVGGDRQQNLYIGFIENRFRARTGRPRFAPMSRQGNPRSCMV